MHFQGTQKPNIKKLIVYQELIKGGGASAPPPPPSRAYADILILRTHTNIHTYEVNIIYV